MLVILLYFFFFNDTATTEIYTLSLHDALPILTDFDGKEVRGSGQFVARAQARQRLPLIVRAPLVGHYRVEVNVRQGDRSRRRSEEHTLNSSHANISYAVFCLKKKKQSMI